MRNSIAALILLTACDAPASVPCSADEASACRVDQHGCEMQAGAPTCIACEVGTRANGEGRCAAIPGTALTHEFPDVESDSGQEILGLCRSWTLHNETDLWVQSVELQQAESSHHSNWLYVPEGFYAGDDEVWDCASRDYHQLNAALAGGVLYAQSTQARHEVQQFPEGAAIRIPAHSMIVSDVHILNTTAEAVRGHATVSIYSIPQADVRIPLAPFHITIEGLDIPPRTRSRFETRCDIAPDYESSVGAPPAWRLFYSLPHTHALGVRVFLEAIGGPHDGESLLDVNGFNGEARGLAYDPPMGLDGVTGFRFGCEFENPRAEVVHWGFGDQEMCEMLGFMESRAAFESSVAATTATGTDGTMPVYSGSCTSFVIPWEDRF